MIHWIEEGHIKGETLVGRDEGTEWTAASVCLETLKGGAKGGKGGAAEERRRAPDGNDYAKAEFIAFYGGSVEWNAAETAVNHRGRHDSVDV